MVAVHHMSQMLSLTHDVLWRLLAHQGSPCLSLFQPTHRHHPGNQQDPIRFRNLVKEIEASLRRRYSAQDASAVLEPFHALAGDHAFWSHTLDGLAIFATPAMFEAYGLQRPVAELAVVAESFHVKPVIRFLQSADRYQVLGLSGASVRLFDGTRDTLDEIALAPGIPRTLTDALGTDRTEPHVAMRSHGEGPGRGRVFHGRGATKDEVQGDTERFFRVVDRGAREQHSRPSGLPLLLAALRQHQSLFRQVSHNPFLVEQAIDINPATVAPEDLRVRAWNAVAPAHATRLRTPAEQFLEAESRGRGTRALHDAAVAVTSGRVAHLLIDADRQIPGTFDGSTGRVSLATLDDPDIDDLLDDLGERVLRGKGQVVVVPHGQMPTESGVAAIYRF